MLFRILGEVVIGVLLAGIVAAILVPAAMQLGFNSGPWLAWVSGAASVAACVAIGERMHRRRSAASRLDRDGLA